MKDSLGVAVWLAVGCMMASCGSHQVTGLWKVEEVRVGTQEMGPVARWVRFHPDGSQVSGNGWKQHSAGTWEMDGRTNKLAVINANGLDDPYGPFRVSWAKDTMQWTRDEDGTLVTIVLIPVEKLPMAPADRLLGLWEMKRAFMESTDITDSLQRDGMRTLFFRWDNRFVLQEGSSEQERGYYVTHAHRNQVELIFHGTEERQRWEFEAGARELTMRTEMNEHLVKITYQRIRQFPE